MSITLVSLLALTGLLAAAQDPPAAADSGAAAVLARARAFAVGKDDDRLNAETLRLTGVVQVQQMPLKGTFVELHHPAGRARMAWSFPGFGETVEGSDAGVYFEASPMGVDVRRGWRAAAAYRILALRRHVPWRVMYESATLDGLEEVAGERCHRVVLVPKAPAALGLAAADEDVGPRPKADVWYVGEATATLHRVDMEVSVPNRGGGTLSLGFADWREVKGMRFPHKLSRAMHGYVMESTVETFEVGVELPDEALNLPESVQKAVGAKPAADALPDPGWKVTALEAQHVASVRTTCKPAEVSRTLASILPEVMRYIGEAGATVAGPPFTRYHAVGADTLELEVGIPVTAPIVARGRILASALPAGRAVTGSHIGEYHRLGETHAALAKWLSGAGEAADGGPWEVYWTDPGVEPDPRKWRTEVVQPLKAK